MEELGKLMTQLVETLKGLQNQQASLEQSLMNQPGSSKSSIGGIQLQAYDETNETFDSYIQRLQNYINLKDVTNSTTKTQIFLNCIGPKYYQVLKNITAPDSPEKKSYEELVKILKNHIAPEPGEIAQQHRFCLRSQNEHESIANYVAGLKEIGGKCNFICTSCSKSTFDTHLRVQFVRGLRCTETKERLLQESPSTKFDDIVKTALAIETSKLESKAMGHDNMSSVNKISIKKNTYNKGGYQANKSANTGEKKEIQCYRCGKMNHKAIECRLNWEKLICKKCNKKGHVQAVCFHEMKQLEIQDELDQDSDEEIFEIHKIQINKNNEKFTIRLQLQGKVHTWELDTGAAVTTCSEKYYEIYFKDLQLEKTKIKLKTYTGEIIEPIGTCTTKIKYKNKEIEGRLFVIKKNVDPVVGREWIRDLNLNFQINKMETVETLTEDKFKEKLTKLLEEYEDLFSEEIGEIQDYQVSFALNENVTPVFLKPRPVPFALKEKVEEEIDRLEKQGIIEKVTYSKWGTPVVPVVKPNGNVRLCADYRSTLNKNLQNDNYPIPRIEEIFAKLSGGKYFCILDIKQAYLHMKTDANTAEMQAISTCKGTYKVHRLMFGVKVAPNQWQRYMDQTLTGITGTACFFDDIAIQGNTYIELIGRISQVFQKLRECGLHLNKKKCQFFQKSVTYLGHTINEQGLHPTQEKVNEIINSPRPTNISALRTFLGMVNYYQQFIPNMASKLTPLYQLLQKNTKFTWSKECQNAFESLKKEICSEKVLTPFQVELPVILATDASPTGYGAVLSHIMPDGKERPVAFASKSLSKTEKRYSQLDKEAAALIWGLKKFFQYCYGRKITLIIDNQPLSRILHPEKQLPNTTAIRLVHYANFLAGFNYDIKLRKTTEHANADYLSRLEHTENNTTEILTDDDMYYLNQISMMPVTMKEIKQATAKDTELRKLIQEIQSGTGNMSRLHEFSLQENCIFYGTRIIIPKELQPQLLQELHTAHTGIVKMKAIARSYVWWKNIDIDIERLVRECKTCCLLQKNPTKVQIHSWEFPKEPWSRVHIDYAGPFLNSYFLIVVDAYTKWLEVIPTTTITATATINILKKLFTTFGLPITVVSDNGRQFRSEEMMNYLKENGVQSKFTAPFHPATNGQAERYVQTFKNKLKSMQNEPGTLQDKIAKFLMMYRKTPNSATGLSPAELMFKRLYRTRIDLVKRDPTTKIEKNNNNEQIIQNKEFEEGERVQIRFYDSNKWRFGMITNRKGKLHYEVNVDGRLHVRHIDQMRKTSCSESNDKKIPLQVPTSIGEVPVSTKEPDNEQVHIQVRNSLPSISDDTLPIPETSIPIELSPTPTRAVVEEMLPTIVEPVRRGTRARRPPDRLNL